MRIYVVGGAVRDRLLGLAVHDRDYVVVGATPKEMLDAGYLPVGRDFPVFLHPQTREEYALARTERKTAPGYGGFVFYADPGVTLEEDLARRDLTVNAMAESLDGGELVDPFGGLADLKSRSFRHVGAAFVEDPVRLLRIARFLARFTDFSVVAQTEALLVTMVQNGEVDALVPERVWAELARGLVAEKPSRMIDLLVKVGALQRIAPGAPEGPAACAALDRAARSNSSLAVRFSVFIAHAADVAVIATCCDTLRVPKEVRDLAVLLAAHGEGIANASELNEEETLGLLESSDAIRRPERFSEMLVAAEILQNADAPGSATMARTQLLRDALICVKTVDAGAVAKMNAGKDVKQAVHAARLEALQCAKGVAVSEESKK